MEELTFIIEKDQEKERIDKAIASFETDWSRTQIQNFIKDGVVLVNNEPAKTSYKVKDDSNGNFKKN